jgi:hypothetical protein
MVLAVLALLPCASRGVYGDEADVVPPRKLVVPDTLVDGPKFSESGARADATAPPVRPLVESRAYLPLAQINHAEDISRPLTDNVWVVANGQFPTPSAGSSTNEPETAAEPLVELTYSDADERGPFWSQPLEWQRLPIELLFEPPLANQRAPRMAAKFTNLNNESTIETAIGGQFGIYRLAPIDRIHEGIQIDGMAAVFTRFNERRLLVTSDFRAGVPLTYAKGPWQARLAYEHTSTHLGDEFIAVSDRAQVPHVRDEIVLGLARRFFDQLRLYGEVGLSFITSDVIGDNIDRYDWGIEWSRQCTTNWKGRPFAAFDMDLRSDQDYTPNLTVQLGWQWKEMAHRRSGRIALEFYDGKSPYGQFFLDDEDWIGLGFYFDW